MTWSLFLSSVCLLCGRFSSKMNLLEESIWSSKGKDYFENKLEGLRVQLTFVSFLLEKYITNLEYPCKTLTLQKIDEKKNLI